MPGRRRVAPQPIPLVRVRVLKARAVLEARLEPQVPTCGFVAPVLGAGGAGEGDRANRLPPEEEGVPSLRGAVERREGTLFGALGMRPKRF